MKTTFISRASLAALLVLLGIASTPAYAAVAGRVLVSVGDSVAIRNGQEIRLRHGSPIEDQDTLRTGATGTLQVRFTDQSIVALREKSTFKLEQYAYPKEKSSAQTAVFNLIKGGFRTITGLIGKSNPKNYSVKTAAATIGIRGTHYAVRVCEDDCKNPDGSNAKDGVYGSVLSASDKDSRIVINNHSGENEFGRDEHFYVKDEKSAPEMLLVPPAFIADNLHGRGQIAEKGRHDDGKNEDKGGAHRDSRADMVTRTFESKVTVIDPNCTTGDCRNLPPPPLQRGSVAVTGKVGHMAGLSGGAIFSTGLISKSDKLTLNPSGELIRVAQEIPEQVGTQRILDIGLASNVGAGRNAIAGNLAWGAWVGNGITEQSTGINGTFNNRLDSFVYLYGDATGVLPNRITATYQPIGGIAVDLNGNMGKITGGDIKVDFFLQLVSLNNLTVGMGNRSFTYNTNTVIPVLFTGGTFSDSGPATCTGLGCLPQQIYNFSAGGAFTGTDAQGIGLHYDLVNITTITSDQITGVEGFLRTDYAPVTAGVLTAYAGVDADKPLYSVADNDAIRLSTERTLDVGGNLTAYSTATGDSARLNVGGTDLNAGTTPNGPAGDHFGRWNNGSITGNSTADAGLPVPALTPASGVHYLYTAALTLPEVIAARTGTVNLFNHAGGTNPTDHLGTGGGTFTGNLNVDFDANKALMNADWSVGLTTPITYKLTNTPLTLSAGGGGVHIGASLPNDVTTTCSACSGLNGTIDQLNIQGNFSGAAGNTINMAISTFDAGIGATAPIPVTSASVQVFQEAAIITPPL
ncbi:MAG: FecR family protein [Candidatus Nitrotoga sp.]